jgi:hypothetical protein
MTRFEQRQQRRARARGFIGGAPPALRNLARCVCVLALALAGSLTAAEKEVVRPTTHAQLLAVYLNKLPGFTEWPKGTFADANAPFVYGILGDDPFEEDSSVVSGVIKSRSGERAMQAILRFFGAGEFVRIRAGPTNVITRKLTVKQFARIDNDITNCHLLFITSSMERRWPEVLKLLEKSSVLTVGDAENFIDRDGMINCVAKKTVDGKERMNLGVNLPAARRNNLRLDPGLYSVAGSRIKS